MLSKNEIPILEYDYDEEGVIKPAYEKLDIKLPARCVIAIIGEDFVDSYAKSQNCKKLAEFSSLTRKFSIYVLEHQGVEVCFCQAPIGSCASVQLLEWLIGYGVKEIVAVGCCGTLVGFPENVFLLPTRALRDEGTSYHYLPAARYVDLNGIAVSALANTLQKNNIPYTECMTWTTDGFFRETKEKVAYRKSEGCSVVDMECAGLASCAQFRGVLFAELLFTADSLADVEKFDGGKWGKDSYSTALKLALEAAVAMC